MTVRASRRSQFRSGRRRIPDSIAASARRSINSSNVVRRATKRSPVSCASLEIDIAVDLNGYTQGSRRGIFARRAAPIQVNYLGYAATMGADHYDYIIGDRTVIPQQQFEFYAREGRLAARELYGHRRRPDHRGANAVARRVAIAGGGFCVLLLQSIVQDQSRDLRRLDAAFTASRRQRVVAPGLRRRDLAQPAARSRAQRSGAGAADLCESRSDGRGSSGATASSRSVSRYPELQRSHDRERCALGRRAGPDVSWFDFCGAGGGEPASRCRACGTGDGKFAGL